MSSPTIQKLYETQTQWCDKHQEGSEYIIHPQSFSASNSSHDEDSENEECERNGNTVTEFCKSCKTNFTPKDLSAFGDETTSHHASSSRRDRSGNDTRKATHSQFVELTSPVFDRKLASKNPLCLLEKLKKQRESSDSEEVTDEVNELKFSDEKTDLCKKL